MSSKSFPAHARIVVIGGGVIGASIAFHLTRAGERDVVLLEKAQLTDGATWHAAGLVGQLRAQRNLTRVMQDSVRLYERLAEETDQDPGWNKVGSLRIAASADRWRELLRMATAARGFGFEMSLTTPAEAKALFPLMSTEGVIGAIFVPDDGYVDPYSLTQAFAKGIRAGGGRIFERVRVTDLVRSGDRITHVATDHGTIQAEIVVNAAGLWARQVGWMAGVDIPAGVVQHQFLVTEKNDQVPDHLPSLRDPDGSFYVKSEPGALAIGGWEKYTPPVDPERGIPWESERHLFGDDLERLNQVFEPAARRIPMLGDLGIRTIVNGPIPISADGEPIVGQAPGLENFFLACGFTSGIAAAGGIGKAMANWIVEGDPGLDLWPFDIRRFGPLHSGSRFLHDRAVESYSRYYAIGWPGHEHDSARGVRRSPLYQVLKEQGAVYGAKFGWERPNWFARGDIAPVEIHGFDRPLHDRTIGPEHRAARQGVVLIDQTSFSKFEISGPGVCRFLQYMAVADVGRAPGSAAYTQLCNARGGIEADVTIIRRAEDRYWLITGSALGVRDGNWLRANLRRWGGAANGVSISDITSAYGVINLSGPLSRRVLEKVTDEDVGHDAFPFMTARDIRIGYAPAQAFRITYIGELGWELYIPVEYVAYVYERLHEAGGEFAIADIGYKAIDSLRIEKRYLVWGSDITPDYNPFEAGLQFLIDWKKPDFLGAEALGRIRDAGVTQKLICLALDEPLAVYGGEAINLDGRIVGRTTSGNYGYTVEKSLVLGYLPVELLSSNRFEVEAFDRRTGATLIKGAAYDPERRKILC